MMTDHHGRTDLGAFLRLLIMMACAVLLPWAPAGAAAEAWRAATVQGEATLQHGEAPPVALAEGRELEPGERLATAASARVVLARGTSTITVGPNARMEIPAGGDDGVRTRIVQAMGSLLFKVEKRASQHFEVETPYLAAVVKGTTFTVSVDGETSAVHVVEGAVEVKALATGQVGMVKPGYTAVVSARKGRSLSIIGGKHEASGKAPGSGGASEEVDEAEPADRAGGRAAAPGQVKRLHAMLGQASVDVAATSKGFVRNASLGNADHGRADAASSSAGKGKAKGLSKEKSNKGKSAGSPGAAKASGGSPGGAKAVGLTKSTPAGGSSTVASQNRANLGKLLAALAKAREEARKRRLNVGGGGEIGDDDDDDDDD